MEKLEIEIMEEEMARRKHDLYVLEILQGIQKVIFQNLINETEQKLKKLRAEQEAAVTAQQENGGKE